MYFSQYTQEFQRISLPSYRHLHWQKTAVVILSTCPFLIIVAVLGILTVFRTPYNMEGQLYKRHHLWFKGEHWIFMNHQWGCTSLAVMHLNFRGVLRQLGDTIRRDFFVKRRTFPKTCLPFQAHHLALDRRH